MSLPPVPTNEWASAISDSWKEMLARIEKVEKRAIIDQAQVKKEIQDLQNKYSTIEDISNVQKRKIGTLVKSPICKTELPLKRKKLAYKCPWNACRAIPCNACKYLFLNNKNKFN